MEIKYEKIETNPKSPLKIVPIQINQNTSQKVVQKHWHRSLEIIIPYEEGTELWVEGKTYHLYPHTMYLVNSTYIHECRPIHYHSSYLGYAIQIKYDFLKDIIPDIDKYQFQEFYDDIRDNHLFQIIKNIIDEQNSSSSYQYLKIQSLFYELCYELCQHYCLKKNKKTIQTSKEKSKIVNILSYLDTHAKEPFDAKKLADEFYMSYGYIAKIFKMELGMTMKEYVNSVRVRNASFDLLSTNLPIIDIALQHGFVDSKSFYKEFKKVYMMTPHQYRKIEKQI